MVNSSLRKFLKDTLKPMNREEERILDSYRFRNDKLFVFYLFVTHILFYLLLLLPPIRFDSFHYLPHFLLISMLRIILFLGVNHNHRLVNSYVYISDFVAYGILYYVFISTLKSYPVQDFFYMINSYSLIGVLIILVYSVRIERLGCVHVASYLIFLQIIFFCSLDKSIHFSTSALLFVPVVFLISALLGTFFILNKQRNLIDLNKFSEEKKFLEQELELAKKVQDALFPKLSANLPVKFHFYRTNPQIIGGDFFDFVQLREGNLGVFFTDVAGHGISSALVAAILKVMVSTIPYPFKLSPGKLLGYLDTRLALDLNRYHASAIYLFFDFSSQTLRIGNAGHPYILHSQQGGPFREVVSVGSILGFQIREPIVEELSLKFSPGDRFFLYTDGLTECLTQTGQELGSEGLLPILDEVRQETSLAGFSESIIQKLKETHGITSFADDTMFLVIEI